MTEIYGFITDWIPYSNFDEAFSRWPPSDIIHITIKFFYCTVSRNKLKLQLFERFFVRRYQKFNLNGFRYLNWWALMSKSLIDAIKYFLFGMDQIFWGFLYFFIMLLGNSSFLLNFQVLIFKERWSDLDVNFSWTSHLTYRFRVFHKILWW